MRRYHLKVAVDSINEIDAFFMMFFMVLLIIFGKGVMRELFILFIVRLLFEGPSEHILNYIFQTVTFPQKYLTFYRFTYLTSK